MYNVNNLQTQTKGGFELYDYEKLIGRIYLKVGNKNKFAKQMNITNATLDSLLSGKSQWRQDYIEKACKLLDLDSPYEIPIYFFTKKVGERKHEVPKNS